MNTILVIEDDNWLRGSILATLERNGFATVEAADGTTGLALARSHQPDLVLSDINLPDIDGYEVLRLLRAGSETLGIPLILMTGATEANTVRYSMEQGADDYLPKPVGTETLVKAVKTRLARKRSVELQVREVSSQLLAIMDATPNLVTVFDGPSRNMVYLNPAGRAMLGLGCDEETSQILIHDHFQDKNGSKLFDSYLEIDISAGKWLIEGKIINRQGQSLAAEIQLLAPRAGFERNTWLCLVARDLTQTIQLRQAHKMEGIGRLATGVAHEINTPIQFTQHNLYFIKETFKAIAKADASYERLLSAATSGLIPAELLTEISNELAQTNLVDMKKEIEESLGDALKGTERVAKIVKAMKEFSHPGRMHGDRPEAADLNQVIGNTITVAQNEWKYIADLVTEFDPDMPPVPLIVGEFSQVILNLLVNAAHAISSSNFADKGRGTITVCTKRSGSWAEVSIRDTGTGIPESMRHRIFEPFFTTKDVGQGTGQGLALAKAVILEKHKGDIGFETEMGHGTRFIIKLPLKT